MKLFKQEIKIALVLLLALSSCKLVDSPIEPGPTIPTRDVRYVVNMTSSSTNSEPQISYTNAYGSTTQVTSLSLDLTVAIDSGSTVNLSASCIGYYSAISNDASAAIEIQLFVADTLAADSSVIVTNNLNPVSASASVSAFVE